MQIEDLDLVVKEDLPVPGMMISSQAWYEYGSSFGIIFVFLLVTITSSTEEATKGEHIFGYHGE